MAILLNSKERRDAYAAARDAQAFSDEQNLRRATGAILDENPTARSVGVTAPSGPIAPTVQAPQPVQPAPPGRGAPAQAQPAAPVVPPADAPSQVGLMGTPGIQQIDPEASYPQAYMQRWQAGLNMDNRMRSLRQAIIPVPGRMDNGSLRSPTNLVATGLNEAARGLEYYLGAGKTRRDQMDKQEAMHRWYGGDMFSGGEGSKLLHARPDLLSEAEANPEAFYDKHSGVPAGTTVSGGTDNGAGVPTAGAQERKTTRRSNGRNFTEVQEQAGVADTSRGPVRDALTKAKPAAPKKMVNVQLLNNELQDAISKRKILFNMADAYRRAGLGGKYIEALGTLDNMTATVRNLAQQKAINLFENSGDPRMLQQMWSQAAGQQITIVPRSDGKWNVMADGAMANEGVSIADIVSPARASASQEFVKSINAAAADRVAKFNEAQWSAQEKAMVEQIKNLGKAQVARMEADNWKMADPEGGAWILRNGRLHHTIKGEVPGPDGETVEGINRVSTTLSTRSMGSILEQAKGLY